MPQITPDNVTNRSVVRVVAGSRSMFVLDFIVAAIANADTVDVSGQVSVCDGAWFQLEGAAVLPVGITQSGTGGTTLTFTKDVAGQHGKLFVVGTP
jgi:hypothetical protein